ncbi:hypothetical protein RvY_07396-2 [Ramazzottius varieornatus]|uniref:Uncharacterized protein n=1 Tax=Ramazzottius varieornatus TaxID=947166 RepID=A0A1D1VAG5_RAMVA|nr:hypothetical protein RvY_07396-2 [Ramazzottius varieornatus]
MASKAYVCSKSFSVFIFLLTKIMLGLAQVVTSPLSLTSVPLGPFGIEDAPTSAISVIAFSPTTAVTTAQPAVSDPASPPPATTTQATPPPTANVANPASANSLPGQAADFIHTLNHEQLVSFLQIMLMQNGAQASRPAPAVDPTGLPPAQTSSLNADDKNVVVNVNVHGTNGYGPSTSGSSPGSPLLQLTIFRKAAAKGLLRSVDKFSQSELGKYVTDLHGYWASSNPEKRVRNRSLVQRHIDHLNVSSDLKQAIREILPGLQET